MLKGGGGGQVKSVSLISVTLVDGGDLQAATDIPAEPTFKLHFNKNVVFNWEHNSNCVSLISQDNENIPVSVTKLDDSADFSQRQNIFVQPVNPLRAGTSYYLKISPKLKAKNGATLGGTNGEEIVITFNTKGEAAVQPPQSAESGDIQSDTASPPANSGTL
nr:Ig-like domain-containing protein [Sporomusa ovata]EQB24907.1 bacterial Ig-like protein [Sporomusa ovata DSM 2662]